MKILLMPNSLKGSLTAGEFCIAAQKALKGHKVKSLPVSDGGDGILEVFKAAYPAAKEYKTLALNAVYKKQKAPYLILPDKKTCVIETAKICGLGALKKSELAALKATSYGIGSVIKEAVKKGAKTFYIGLGGVACNDGGAGMAQALGWRLFDKNGFEIQPGAHALLNLKNIGIKPALLRNIKFIGLSDVKNPLLGAKGSAYVYGPQKGASPAQVKVLEAALKNYARVVKKDLGKNINLPRCAAAGAIGAGISAFLDGALEDGAPFILAGLKASQAVKAADIIITAEGKLDAQTFYGKAPQAVCAVAAKYKKPVFFICGVNEIKNKNLLKKHHISAVAELLPFAKNQQDCIKNAARYIPKAINSLFPA